MIHIRPLIALLMLAALVLVPQHAQAADPQRVDAAVRKAVAYIYSQQKPTGQWETDLKRDGTAHDWQAMQGGTFGGYTALCVFALLEAGEKPGDPRIEKAVQFLRTCDMFGVYSVGLRAMAFSKLPQNPENRAVLQRDADRLLASMTKKGVARGMWDYGSNAPGNNRAPDEGTIDVSISQFGVLGLWSAVQAGANVPPDTWRLLDEAWRKQQLPDGSWSYNGDPGTVRASITAAGVATLLIVQDVLGSPMQQAAGGDPNIVKGITRLSRMFVEIADYGGYAWYAVERVGTAGGIRRIGPYDWYEIGTRRLLPLQQADGSWPSGSAPGMAPLQETAMCVLFLVHGNAPTVIGKFDYSGVAEGTLRAADWNRRPRDAANLIRFLSHVTEKPLNWRTVNTRSAPEEMLSVPVLLASGAKDITLLPAERERLKSYLDQGGLLLCNSELPSRDGKPANDEFSQGVIRLAGQMYPQYKFRELPATHPIFKEQQFRGVGWKEKPVAWGLSNGVRELMVLFPLGDYGRAWQSTPSNIEKMKFEMGANVIQYAVSREPAPKAMSDPTRLRYLWDPYLYPPNTKTEAAPSTQPVDEGPKFDPNDSAATTQPIAPPPPPGSVPPDAKFLIVGRLKVGDNWDPEPGAWLRMCGFLANGPRVFTTILPVEATSADLAKVKVLHWTGTTAVKLLPAQQAAIAAFVKGGGTLIVDAAGGSGLFADSAQQALMSTFSITTKPPASTLPTAFGELISSEDLVFNQPGLKISSYGYRPFTRGKLVGKLDAPRVRALTVDKRLAVFFSREDLSAGCAGTNTDGIIGYNPITSQMIMRNLVMWSMREKK